MRNRTLPLHIAGSVGGSKNRGPDRQSFCAWLDQNTDLRAPAPVDSTENAAGWLKLFALTWAKIRAMLAARVSASQKH
jgi:hypothetical protein